MGPKARSDDRRLAEARICVAHAKESRLSTPSRCPQWTSSDRTGAGPTDARFAIEQNTANSSDRAQSGRGAGARGRGRLLVCARESQTRDRTTLACVNVDQLSAGVLDVLTREASRDPHSWLPAVGWQRSDGTPYGLAAALLGEAATDRQLSRLARVLFRLASRGEIEVALFRRPSDTAGKLKVPQRNDAQTYLMLVGPGSRKLHPGASLEYAARLATG